jgi:hypothetical protein
MKAPRNKHPRTYHFKWSKGIQSDDKVIKNLSRFIGQEVVATIKMDGENTSLYTDYSHARSLDSRHNFTRDWVKKLHSVIRHQIPENISLTGENLWAEHAIRYPDGFLEGYFYLFAVWEDGDTCLSYDDLVMYADLLDLPTPKVVFRGIFDEEALKKITDELDTSLYEGIVVRLAKSFKREEFSESVVKYVRADHVQVDAEHWLKNAKQNGELSKIVKPIYMGNV